MQTESLESARRVGCRYVDDSRPGIRRVRRGRGFRFVGVDGRAITSPTVLRRIGALAIPPAWTDVWICPSATGHIQATGRDARGRKQYRYHARFRAVRDETKFGRVLDFAKALPTLRRRVDADMRRPQLDREKVLATIVRLLEISLIRIGHEEYTRENGSFGLTTMQSRHVDVHGSTIHFHFRGKSHQDRVVDIHDQKLARVVQRFNDLPGEKLFQYVDESGARKTIEAGDVNAYLRTISGDDFTAKDFRTWAGTVLAAHALVELGDVTKAVAAAARRLGNTPAVCRRCYVHPTIFEMHEAGTLADALARERSTQGDLFPHEHAVLGCLLDERRGGRGV